MDSTRKTSLPAKALRRLPNATGFSLIEVLVTAVLIGVGLLGMAALQARAIAYSNETLQRATAAMLANDLLELVRATPGEWSRYLNTALPPTTVARPCAATPSQPAAQFACWRGEVAALLPGSTALAPGETYVCWSPAPGSCASRASAIEVQVAWKAGHSECPTADASCRYRLRSEL